MVMSRIRSFFGFFGLFIMLAPVAIAMVPIESSNSSDEPQGWWTETTVDRDGNGIGDMVEVHMNNPIFLDEDNTLPLICLLYTSDAADE